MIQAEIRSQCTTSDRGRNEYRQNPFQRCHQGKKLVFDKVGTEDHLYLTY